MSKNYKIKHKQENKIIENNKILSKKEEYDLNKQKKEQKKLKKNTKKKKKRKNYQTNLGTRIFAIIMLLLMAGSIIATIATYLS